VQRDTEAFRFLVRVTKVTRWLCCVERLKVLFPLVGSFKFLEGMVTLVRQAKVPSPGGEGFF
jgi:hypothetical protein